MLSCSLYRNGALRKSVRARLLRYVLQRVDEYPDVRDLHVVLQPRDFVVRHQNQVSWLERHVLFELRLSCSRG